MRAQGASERREMADIEKQIERLRQEIRRHDYLYYALSQPEISDKEYDDLLARLKKLEEEYPQFCSPDSHDEP